MIHAQPGTIVVFSDIGCPWATLAVHRLHQARARLGLEGRVVLDHRAFPLELLNGRPTPKRVLDAEIPVVGALEPTFGWSMWQADPSTWPVTTLPALEAVQAAKPDGLVAAEALDLALRRALFVDSRCISVPDVVLDVAGACPGVDAGRIADALADGRARVRVSEDAAEARGDDVEGSPHVFLPDGTGMANPGVRMHWAGDHGRGFPVVDDDDPSVIDDLLRRAARLAA